MVIIALPVVYTIKQNADYARMDREADRLLRGGQADDVASGSANDGSAAGVALTAPGNGLPMLLDLGAGTCIPCREMQPILEQLQKEYDGKVTVQIVDVYEHQDWARKYKVYLIPTQIFFDAQGKELFRHEGFFSRAEILAKFKEYGWMQ